MAKPNRRLSGETGVTPRTYKQREGEARSKGLSGEEIAFYDALAQNESVIEVLGNGTLRLIAHELLDQLRQNATDDWHKRESARARMRVLVKRILKKYGYPPELVEDVVKLVLEQAEALLRQFG